MRAPLSLHQGAMDFLESNFHTQVETNTMSASDHDGKKDDKGGAANYSAINLNKDFLQKLKQDGECLGRVGGSEQLFKPS